jgi:hypothetical protein
MSTLDPSIGAMLDQLEREIRTLRESLVALGDSVVPMLAIKAGQRVAISGGRVMSVGKVTFDDHAYYRDGKWRAGFAAMGTLAAGHTTRHRIVYDLNGIEVSRTTPDPS